jgi:hypothetical protein
LVLVIENIDRSKAKTSGPITIVTSIKFVDSKNKSNIIVKVLNIKIELVLK